MTKFKVFDYYKSKRILVTGHTGFKGSWLTSWLSSLGAIILGYSLSPEKESLYSSFNKENKLDAILSELKELRSVVREQ